MKLVPVSTRSSQVNAMETDDFVTDKRLSTRRFQIGQVESIMTRHASEGDCHFVRLVLANGHLWRGKWQSKANEILPSLGDIVRVEMAATVSEASKDAAAMSSPQVIKDCFTIDRWVVIKAPCPLPNLSRLYQCTEQPQALDRLCAVVDRIAVPPLRLWLGKVLSRLHLAIPFVQVPASRQHHHSHAGGLLLHSVECAEWVEQVAQASLNPKEAALAVTAALLHDFGKIETLRNTEAGKLIAHEVLSLTLLEPMLGELELQWSQGAHALRQMLSWSTLPGKFPKFPGALLVKMADQYSTALSAREMAFDSLPNHYYWASLKTSHSVQWFNRVN